MPYATESDLRLRLADEETAALSSDAADPATVLAAALDDASAEIDAVLGGRYATPFDPAPDAILPLAVDLAVYHLYLRRRAAISPERLRQAREARAQLARWGEGFDALPGASPNLDRFAPDSATLERDRLFDRDSLDSF